LRHHELTRHIVRRAHELAEKRPLPHKAVPDTTALCLPANEASRLKPRLSMWHPILIVTRDETNP